LAFSFITVFCCLNAAAYIMTLIAAIKEQG